MFSTVSSAIALAALAAKVSATYTLEDDYPIATFADNFNFINTTDPTHGFVQYLDRDLAESKKYAQVQGGAYFMSPDFTTVNPAGTGRESVRIESKKQYSAGSLVILDLAHQPESACGLWPSFWMYGPDWPHSGEIDIIESVNMQANNLMTLHTFDDCIIDAPAGNTEAGETPVIQPVAADAPFQGRVRTNNCKTGCPIEAQVPNTVGSAFNAANGGVYATEFAADGIQIWYFPPNAVPADITSGAPNPTSWTRPIAKFSGTGCSYTNQFKNQNIVFDIDFCGDWAGAVWDADPVCSKLAPTCNQYVAENPAAFKDSYWLVNSLKVYQSDAAPSRRSRMA